MKAIVCEMCNSNNIVKDGDFFVCQNCGTKYTVEAAKKLMVEGTVDVSGSTITVDNTSTIERSLSNARRALAKEDWEEVEKYYNKVEEFAPENIEAIFFSSFGKVGKCLSEKDQKKLESALQVLQKSISIITDNYDTKDSNKNLEIIEKTSNYISKLPSIVTRSALYTGLGTAERYCVNVETTLCERVFVETLVKIVKKDSKREYYDIIVKHCDRIIPKVGGGVKNEFESIRKFAIGRDPNAKMDPPKNSGCYVATAVYGSYDCPQVWTLRRYRDYTLAQTWYGRTFIYTYYAISPTIVKWFGKTEWFKKMWRGKLDRLIYRLNSQGVEATPYEDRCW